MKDAFGNVIKPSKELLEKMIKIFNENGNLFVSDDNYIHLVRILNLRKIKFNKRRYENGFIITKGDKKNG